MNSFKIVCVPLSRKIFKTPFINVIPWRYSVILPTVLPTHYSHLRRAQLQSCSSLNQYTRLSGCAIVCHTQRSPLDPTVSVSHLPISRYSGGELWGTRFTTSSYLKSGYSLRSCSFVIVPTLAQKQPSLVRCQNKICIGICLLFVLHCMLHS